MFSDKPPCIPLCFGTINYTARGGRGFYPSFLASTAVIFSFCRLCSSGFFLNFFFLLFLFLQFSFFFLYFFLLSLTQFSALMGYVIVLGSFFSPDGLCNCEHHLVSLMKSWFGKFLCYVSPYFYCVWLIGHLNFKCFGI